VPVEELLTHVPTCSSQYQYQWMAELVAALPWIIIDFTLFYAVYALVLSATVKEFGVVEEIV